MFLANTHPPRTNLVFFFFFFETFPLEGNFNQISDKLYRKLDFKWAEMRILVGTEKIYCCWQFQGSFYSLGSVCGRWYKAKLEQYALFCSNEIPAQMSSDVITSPPEWQGLAGFQQARFPRARIFNFFKTAKSNVISTILYQVVQYSLYYTTQYSIVQYSMYYTILYYILHYTILQGVPKNATFICSRGPI